ncbi:MAG: UDP-glucose/GDP-mannose dehydrogenase family protein [Ruminiclostridium sp.]|nr:UDP-glucose/GDP-mannose dehydrogenase family protein [Ruminiclostridium sp.]
MNISIIGTGYVGLVTGACLASQGNNILCCDLDNDKIGNLKKGILPIYEPGLPELVSRLTNTGNLGFTCEMSDAVRHSTVLFITVNTPTLENNICDLGNVLDVIREIADHMTSYRVIVHKSTVPVGTGRKVRSIMEALLKEQGKDLEFDIVSNPEFLREGSAINDFLNPERIVIGSGSEKAAAFMMEIYKKQRRKGIPLLLTGLETAEMIKYASNAFLAMKISYINEIANICEFCGADAVEVAIGMGLDHRIGCEFLAAGPGFGGSCFPKDLRALSGLGKTYGYDAGLIDSVIETNQRQKKRMVQKISAAVGPLEKSTITFLGISFKPDTDDIRESPSIAIIRDLLDKNARIKIYDPRALDNLKKQFPEMPVTYCDSAYTACEGSDCIVLATEWNEFSRLDFKSLKNIVKRPVFLDLRNVYSPEEVKAYGFHYEGVGRK